MYAAFYIEEIDNGYLVKFRMGFGEVDETSQVTLYTETLGEAYEFIAAECSITAKSLNGDDDDVDQPKKESLLF
jgi:hypothetical protein